MMDDGLKPKDIKWFRFSYYMITTIVFDDGGGEEKHRDGKKNIDWMPPYKLTTSLRIK